MICDIEKTQQQLPLEGVEGSLNPLLKLPLQERISLTPEQEERPKSYYQRHREDRLDYARFYYQKHRTSNRKIKTEQERKESARAAERRYRERHYEKRKSKWRSPEHKKRQADYQRAWLDRNPDKKAMKRKAIIAYHKEHYRTDTNFRLRKLIGSNIKSAFRRSGTRKRSKTLVLLGCSVDEAKQHIESQFTGSMAWNKPNSLHIDHIVPVSAFNLSDPEESKWAFNWQNLQPLTPHENSVKHDTLPSPFPSWLPAAIASRILRRMSK